MKSQLMRMAALIAVCLLTCLSASAEQKVNVGQATYKVEGGEATLADFKKAEGDVTVPEFITGKTGAQYTVVAVGPKAFKKSQATSITLPPSVKTLGKNCFEESKLLRSVSFPTNCIKEIPDNAFAKCESLDSISFEGIEKIGSEAFLLSGIHKAVIPASVTVIDNSFVDCPRLTELVFKYSSHDIKLENAPFRGCPIKSIYLDREFIYDANDYLKRLKGLSHPFNNMETLETFVAGVTVAFVPNDLVANCKELSKLVVGYNVARKLNQNDKLTKYEDESILSQGTKYFGRKIDAITLHDGTRIPLDLKRSKRDEILDLYEVNMFMKEGIEEFNQSHSLVKLYNLYSRYAGNNKAVQMARVINTMIDLLEPLSIKERQKVEHADADSMNGWINDSRYTQDKELPLRAAMMCMQTYNDLYATAQVVLELVDAERYDEAYKYYNLAVELTTERGKYMIPEELQDAGETIYYYVTAQQKKNMLMTDAQVKAKYGKTKGSKSKGSKSKRSK